MLDPTSTPVAGAIPSRCGVNAPSTRCRSVRQGRRCLPQQQRTRISAWTELCRDAMRSGQWGTSEAYLEQRLSRQPSCRNGDCHSQGRSRNEGLNQEPSFRIHQVRKKGSVGASFGCSNAQLGIQRGRHPKRAVKARHATPASHWPQQQQNYDLLADALWRRNIDLRPTAMRTIVQCDFQH
jgi:hypothetical protein